MMFSKATSFLVICVTLHCVVATPSCGCDPTTGKQPSSNQLLCNACPSKKYFSTAKITASKLFSKSPFIVQRYSATIVESQQVTALCHTHLLLFPGIYLFFYTNTFSDGTYSVDLFFVIDGPFGPGTYWFVGLMGPPPLTPFIAVGNVLKDVYCAKTNSTLFGAVTVNVASGCTNNTSMPDTVLVFSTLPTSSQSCVSKVEKYLKSVIGDVALDTTSDKSPIYCVADLYGVRVINYKSLSSNANIKSISYPN